MSNQIHREIKDRMCQILIHHLSCALPYFTPSIFGSAATGIILPSSDIDIILTPCIQVDSAALVLTALAAQLQNIPWISHCHAILTAKIPVLKLITDPYVSFENPYSNYKHLSYE